MWMMVFLLMPLLGIAYIGWHVWTLVPLSPWFRGGLIGFGLLSFFLLFLNLGRVIDHLPLGLARLCYDVGDSSVIVLLYLVLIFLVLDLGRLLRLVPAAWLHQNFYTTMAITLGMFVVFMAGNLKYHHKKRVELNLTTTKTLRKPLKLVMLSDLHLGYHNPRTELHRWVDMINAEQPDYVLIAGDIIDMSMRPLLEENMAEEFRRIKAPVYACLGNHEFYAGVPEAHQFYLAAGIHLLVDEAAVVDSSLVVVGRDDRTNLHRMPIDELVTNRDLYTIVLDHQPYNLERAEAAGVDFQLSGHTHRGQVWPISWITDRLYECSWGSHQRGATQYYVSSGIGIWGGKFRIGTQSEYVVATLRSVR